MGGMGGLSGFLAFLASKVPEPRLRTCKLQPLLSRTTANGQNKNFPEKGGWYTYTIVYRVEPKTEPKKCR
jgi:hypothetical protein